MLLAEIVVNEWLAAGGAILTFLASIAATAYAVRTYFRRDRAEQDTLDAGRRKRASDEQRAARREAADEAWDVVRRQNQIIEGYGPRIEALEQDRDEERERAARCEAEHAATRATLRIIAAWARKKGMPLPDGILAQLGDGSGPHTPLPPMGEQT